LSFPAARSPSPPIQHPSRKPVEILGIPPLMD
jgi:hypothetical protein